MKKILSLITVLILIIISTVPAFAVIAETSDFTYSKMSDGTLEITGYKGNEAVITIPKTYNNKKITAVKSLSVFRKAEVTAIKIYKNIKLIENTNVSMLGNLKTIKVGTSNKYYSASNGVLYNKDKTKVLACPVKQTKVTMPDTVKNIAPYAFYNTALTELSVPKNIQTIGKYSIGAYDLNGTPAYNNDFIISSSKNSVAQEYAKKNKLVFNEVLLIQGIAHRGDMEDSIPDTLKALDKAKENGYAYSEFDIFETKSKDWFVFHDSNLLPQCGVNKSILDVNMSNYKNYPLKVNGMTSYMPTVEQLVSKASKYNIQLYLHMKNSSFTDTGLTKLYNMLKKYNMLEKTRIFSSHQNVLPSLKKKGFHVGFLIASFNSEQAIMDAVNVAYKNKCEFLITNYAAYNLTANAVKYSHSKDIDIGSYKVNTVKKAKQMVNINADFYISNYPLTL